MYDKQSRIVLIILAVVVLGCVLYTWHVVHNKNGETIVLTPQEDFLLASGAAYTTLDGSPVDIKSYFNNTLVVSTWASWCPACGNHLKALQKLGEQHQEDDVVVLAINRKEDPKLVKNYLKTLPSFNHLVMLIDTTDGFFAATGGQTAPETIFFNHNGEVVVHTRGVMTQVELNNHLQTALQQ
ncbi:MAG: TlpA disulfide reductase family protein [Candidatus Paceibacterota bacterium]